MTDSAMYALAAFELPLTTIPTGFGWEDRTSLETFTEETADACVTARDTFRGNPCCVVCGEPIPLQYSTLWDDLKKRGWLPEWANENAEDEPRNAIILCPNHKGIFESYMCFIRYVPSERKFIFVNYYGDNHTNNKYHKYHGKAVALDINDELAPFPALFLLHEQRVRGFQPFSEPSPLLPKEVSWPDWILSRDILQPGADDASRRSTGDPLRPHADDSSQPSLNTSLFRREGPPRRLYEDKTNRPSPADVNGLSGSKGALALNNDVIANILAATRESASWKSAVVENTSWDGTAEENVKKYQDILDGTTQ
ncbi:hypothetical protein EV122DRAFT_213897 [Schizophyllum commune]